LTGGGFVGASLILGLEPAQDSRQVGETRRFPFRDSSHSYLELTDYDLSRGKIKANPEDYGSLQKEARSLMRERRSRPGRLSGLISLRAAWRRPPLQPLPVLDFDDDGRPDPLGRSVWQFPRLPRRTGTVRNGYDFHREACRSVRIAARHLRLLCHYPAAFRHEIADWSVALAIPSRNEHQDWANICRSNSGSLAKLLRKPIHPH
jgi:hypothetical protein